MSKKCRAYSESKLGLEPADNRKAFYAGWDAALAEQPAQQRPQNCGTGYCSCIECPYEQPAQQQEPFGYFKPEPFGWTDCAETDEGAIALYERPQPSKPLTDDEIDIIYTGVRAVHHDIDSYVFARAIEAKLKEKNNG